jgi:hypothetical protein
MERARDVILDANTAYEQFLGNLRAGVPGEELDAGLAAELECWADRPQLPDPSWPNVPTDQQRIPE